MCPECGAPPLWAAFKEEKVSSAFPSLSVFAECLELFWTPAFLTAFAERQPPASWAHSRPTPPAVYPASCRMACSWLALPLGLELSCGGQDLLNSERALARGPQGGLVLLLHHFCQEVLILV